jgi:nitroreductase
MDAIDCILTRRSIRKFKRIPVEWYKIGKIVEAGVAAPSAGNLQDFRILAVTKEHLKLEIAKLCMNQMWMTDAAAYLVVSSTFTKTRRFYGIRGERLYSIQSCAAVAENMLLAAHAQGLGACWVGAFDEDSVRHVCNIPDYYRVQAVIPVGYADEDPPRPPKYEIYHILHLNRWADNSGKSWNPSTEILKDWSPHVMEAIEKTKSTVTTGRTKLRDHIRKGLRVLPDKIIKALKERAAKRKEENMKRK